VDNGSADGSADRIQTAFPDLNLLRLPNNLGFAGGNNRAIEQALQNGTDYLLLLNNDTTVDPGILKAFVHAWKTQPDPGFLNAKIFFYDEPEKIWAAITRWNPDQGLFEHIGNHEPDRSGSFNNIMETDYASGCALFFHRSTIDRVGLMDERFFCYFEEADWCYRARHAGLTSYFIPDAKVWHKVATSSRGKTSPIVQYYRTRNLLLWARKNLPRNQRRTVWRQTLRNWLGTRTWRTTPKQIYWNLLMLRRDPILKARGRAIRDYLLQRFGPVPGDL
jgi:GT2 family glycosyltransferase